MASTQNPSLDVVIPLYNEAEIVEQLHERVSAACEETGLSWRVIYVDDGSQDQTVKNLKDACRRGQFVEIVSLSRNFGQPAAISAGLNCCSSDVVVLMDGDLQDPPELIPALVDSWREGFQIVIAQRPKRQESGRLRGLMFRSFHGLFAWLTDLPIPPDCGTFCLLTNDAVQAIQKMPECHRYFPGLRAWIGFPQKLITYERPDRVAGSPKQTLGRLFRYAGDAIFGFSRKPAKILCFLGAALWLFVLAGLGMVAIASTLGYFSTSAASTPMLVGLCTAAVVGTQLICTGVITAIAFRIQEQAKQRPLYYIADHFRNDRALFLAKRAA